MLSPIKNSVLHFDSLHPVISKYILRIIDDPITRKVSKLWRKRFNEFCHDAWMRVENDKNEPEIFRKGLEVVRNDFEKLYPKLKGDGFALIYNFFNKLIKNWEPSGNLKAKIKFNNHLELRNLLYKTLKDEFFLKFLGLIVTERSQRNWTNDLANKKAAQLIKKNDGIFHLKTGESRLNTYLDEIEDFKTHLLIFQQNQLTDYYQSPFEKSIFKVINLSKNGFAQFPLPLLLCKNLEELDLSYNKMKTLPKEICQLTKLSKLTLTGNELTELSEGIGILSKLKYFAVEKNNLTEIPSGLCYLKQLQTICLENNNPFVRKRIMKIPTVVFNEACRSDSLASQQDKLEKQLGLFFNMEALKEEQNSWVSSSPLGTLYERIIISEKQRTLFFANQGKEEDLKEYVKALSIEDLHLFYEMIFVCSTLWHQSISDKSFPIIKKVENRIRIGKNIFAKGVTEQILHQAVAEAIIKKYKNLDKNERSEVEERIRIAAKAPNTNDPNQDKELALSNLPHLAEVMDSQHSFCVIS